MGRINIFLIHICAVSDQQACKIEILLTPDGINENRIFYCVVGQPITIRICAIMKEQAYNFKVLCVSYRAGKQRLIQL